MSTIDEKKKPTPLADREIGAAVLDQLHHIAEIVLLLLVQIHQVLTITLKTRSPTLPDLISTSCFVFGFGGSKGHVSRQIFAFLSTFGICGCENPLSSTSPLIRHVSSSLPPVFVWTQRTIHRVPSV